MAAASLVDQVLALLVDASDDVKRGVLEAVIESMRTPINYTFDELEVRLKDARGREAEAPSDSERLQWARRRFDLDFEYRRRRPSRWLGFQPPEPHVYPEGLGPDEAYPDWLGPTQA